MRHKAPNRVTAKLSNPTLPSWASEIAGARSVPRSTIKIMTVVRGNGILIIAFSRNGTTSGMFDESLRYTYSSQSDQRGTMRLKGLHKPTLQYIHLLSARSRTKIHTLILRYSPPSPSAPKILTRHANSLDSVRF